MFVSGNLPIHYRGTRQGAELHGIVIQGYCAIGRQIRIDVPPPARFNATILPLWSLIALSAIASPTPNVKAKRVSLFGFYMLNFAKADTSVATYFPSNQFNPGADFGRANFDVRNRFLLGGNLQCPYGVSFSPMLVTNSGTPFNITTGQDLNGDNQYNDRPAFATAASTDVAQTNYGTFDLNPSSSEARIPYNYGTGSGQFSMNMRVSKALGIGPKVEGSASGGGMGGPGGPPPGGGPGGGGPPGGGLGPGGLSRSGGPPRLDQAATRRYSLNFAAMTRNVFNNVNLAAPVSVLESPLFGKSNALAGGFFSSPASNRSIDLQMSFNF